MMGVSLVMPAYNEEGCIEAVVKKYHAEVISKLDQAEFIVVDDCSTDRTWEILKRLSNEYGILVIRPPRNGGHGKAVRLGLAQAKYDVIFQSDSDDQNDPHDFWELYRKLPEYDYVIGYRQTRHDPLHRLVITRIVRFLSWLLYGYWIKDSNSPFKVLKKKVLDEVLPAVPPDTFAPSILIAYMAKATGFKVAEVPVKHLPRTTGKVSIMGWKLFKICCRCVEEFINFVPVVRAEKRKRR